MSARFYLICTLATMSLLACRNQPKNSSAQADSLKNTESKQIDSLRNMVFLMLSPNEILNEIFSAKVTFYPQLLNPRDNAPKYLDVKHQALNLGVYVSDFAYLNLCQNKSFSLEYFKIIRDLAQKNNIYGCFNESVFNRIQNNLANNDSLIGISQEMYYNMTDILENANRQNITALISSGVLVESLYLSMMVIDKLPNQHDAREHVIEQKQLFDNIYAFLQTNHQDKDVESVMIQLKELKKTLDKLNIKSQKTIVTKDQKNHLVIKGGQSNTFDEAIYKELKDKVVVLRHTFITIN